MSIEDLAKGLEILMAAGARGHCIAAEHDVIYAGGEPGTETPEQRAALEALGWFVDTEVNSWSHFT